MPDKGLKKKYREALRRGINRRNRERLRNQAPTIIANNCNGGVISHDLGLKFRTPTVNLYIPFPDYVRFCEGLPHYLALPESAMRRGGGVLRGLSDGRAGGCPPRVRALPDLRGGARQVV